VSISLDNVQRELCVVVLPFFFLSRCLLELDKSILVLCFSFLLLVTKNKSLDHSSTIQQDNDEHEDQLDTVDQPLEHATIPIGSTSGALSTGERTSSQPAQKLFAHQFYDVYAGMNDDEWIKVRNAFVAQYFNE
jgi:hypothetical protein